MPKVELYINSQLCDLTGEEQIEVDYTSFDISKIGSRGGARSYSFNLPKTNLNKSVLENPEMVNNLSQIPYTRLPCLILVDGIDVQIRFAEIESAGSVYAVRVYGANSDLFAELKDKKAWDIDLKDYNHYWIFDTVYESRLNTEGYIYPVIDWQSDSPNFAINNDNKVVRNDFMLAALFYNTVLERIFRDTNYTLVNEVEADTANLLIASGQARRNEDMGRYEASISTDMATGNLPAGAFNIIFYTTPSADYDYGYWNDISLALGASFIDDIDVDINVDFEIRNNLGIPLDLVLRVHDAFGVINTYTVNILAGATIPYNISLPNTEMRANGNVYAGIFIDMQASSGTAGAIEILTSTITFSNVVLVAERPNEAYSHFGSREGFVTPSSIMPDVTQVEIFKNYLLMFGLIPSVNEITKVVTLVAFDKLISNLSRAYDWSDKLDFSQEAETKFLLDNYAQNNWFRYKQDGEEIKPAGTDGNIQIANGNLELEKDIVQLIYAGTNMVTRLEDNVVPNIGVYLGGVKQDSREPRVLILDNKTPADIGGNVTYDDTTSTQVLSDTIPMCYFILDGKVLNLGFQNNLLPSYYELISDVLNRVKITTMLVRLSAADISTIDFTRPVWIQKHEAYFYISSIKGFSYTENKSTIVELVKLNING
jgi:hypothetical protein